MARTAVSGLVLAVVDVKNLIIFIRQPVVARKRRLPCSVGDGTMLIRYPNRQIGDRREGYPQRSPWYVRVAKGGGNYVTPGVLDGTRSLVSVHPLAEYPLVVDVLVEELQSLSVDCKRRRSISGLRGGWQTRLLRTCSGCWPVNSDGKPSKTQPGTWSPAI